MKKFKMNLKILSAMTLGVGAVILLLNFIFLSAYPMVYALVNVAGAVVVIGIPLLYKFNQFKKIRVIEELFPKYLNDIAENISAGMTLPQAMRSAANIEYGVMTPYVREIASKVSWGITFERIINEEKCPDYNRNTPVRRRHGYHNAVGCPVPRGAGEN